MARLSTQYFRQLLLLWISFSLAAASAAFAEPIEVITPEDAMPPVNHPRFYNGFLGPTAYALDKNEIEIQSPSYSPLEYYPFPSASISAYLAGIRYGIFNSLTLDTELDTEKVAIGFRWNP